MHYFSGSYFESREKFLSAAGSAGGVVKEIRHPSALGPEDEPLFVDYAVFGDPEAEKVLFNINGVHGIESYSGAAAQLQQIETQAARRLPAGVKVVMIHNINPYGWAHHSQRNEDLLDLNRNFVDFENLPESDDIHDKIANAIKFEGFSFEALGRAWNNIQAVADQEGRARFNSALMVGQYISPRALKFGGTKPSWSNKILRTIAKENLAGASKVAYLDWHTGLGDYGLPYELHTWPKGSESWKKTEEWWGSAAVERGGSGLMSGTDNDGDASTGDVNGLALEALVDAAPNAIIAGGPVEFGTVPFELIAQAAILDHWMMLDAREQGLDTRFWKTQLRTLFTPRDPWWERSVLSHAASFYERMLSGLSTW